MLCLCAGEDTGGAVTYSGRGRSATAHAGPAGRRTGRAPRTPASASPPRSPATAAASTWPSSCPRQRTAARPPWMSTGAEGDRRHLLEDPDQSHDRVPGRATRDSDPHRENRQPRYRGSPTNQPRCHDQRRLRHRTPPCPADVAAVAATHLLPGPRPRADMTNRRTDLAADPSP